MKLFANAKVSRGASALVVVWPRLTAVGALAAVVALGALVVLALLAAPAAAFDREITREELDRIEAVRQRIAEHGYGWEAGVTSVSHLTLEELLDLCGTRVPADLEERRARAKREGRMIEAIPGMLFPSAFDWRDYGGVTSIKNQGNCGSCWAFAATAALEAQVLIYSGLDEDLSEQAVVDCNAYGDGCDGGWMSSAYELWMDYGAVREACVPYHAIDTEACTQSYCDVAAIVDSYYAVGEDVSSLKTALLDGPVAVAVAVCGGFETYTGGCYEDVCTDINHGVLLVGWDDTMCGGEGAWIVKNSWGPDWGVDGYINMKYGTCLIGYGAEAINYTPGQTVHFFYDSHSIADGGDGDGVIEVGEPITIPITILNIGAETAAGVSAVLRSLTAGVTVTDSTAIYPDIARGTTAQSNANHFGFTVTGAGPLCGPIRLQLAVSSAQGSSTTSLKLQAGPSAAHFADDFESDQGWSTSAAGDNATTGRWTRVDPNGTWWGDQPVQPEDDHTTAPGTMCMATGQAAVGATQGAADVDGGKTTLTSPAIDLSDKDSAVLTYWRWYASETGSAPNEDDFVVDVSSDNGLTWVNLETLAYSDRVWRRMEFNLEEYVALTSQVKVRFIAQDTGSGSIVEAAVDDFAVTACEEAAPDVLPPTVAVLAPDGGEVLEHGTECEILWSADDNIGVTEIKVSLSLDGGSTYPVLIAEGETDDGSYLWAVPDLDSKTARVRVEAFDAAANQASDASDADFTLWGTTSGVDGGADGVPDGMGAGVPGEIVLGVENGNPLRVGSRVVYGLPGAGRVRIGLYDVNGRLLATALDARVRAGYGSVEWSTFERRAPGLGSGIYFIRMDSGAGARTVKVVLAK